MFPWGRGFYFGRLREKLGFGYNVSQPTPSFLAEPALDLESRRRPKLLDENRPKLKPSPKILYTLRRLSRDYHGCSESSNQRRAHTWVMKIIQFREIFFCRDLFPFAAIRTGWFGIVGWVGRSPGVFANSTSLEMDGRQSCTESNPPFSAPVRRFFERMTSRRLGKWWVGLRTSSKGAGVNKL